MATPQPHRMTAKEYFQFRRDQIEIESAENLEKRLASIEDYSPEQIRQLIEQDAKARQVEPTETVDVKRYNLVEQQKKDADRQKQIDLKMVASDEKERAQLMAQIEPGAWVTIHWLMPFRERDGRRKVRAATISGQVESVQLDRAQVSFRCNSRPEEEEIKIHHIEKDSLVEAPLDCVTSVSL